MSIVYIEIPKPKGLNRLSNRDILIGAPIASLDRLRIVDEDTYEDIILEWATSYLNEKYEKTKALGGSGDKGRDICAYTDLQNQYFDLFQCKHYANKLSFSMVSLEFGKLIYYTYNKDYPTPQKYYFVSPLGMSSSLWDLITINHNELKSKILACWDKDIKKKITKSASISMDDKLEDYINNFDFSIFSSLEPLEFIEQFRQTPYFAPRFGGGLQKERNVSPIISTEIKEHEVNYVKQLFEAYSDYKKELYLSITDLEKEKDLESHFHRSRNCFYLAETLEQFSRDNIPTHDAFKELKDEVLEQVIDICNQNYTDGYCRLIATTTAAKQTDYASNALFSEIKAQDKTGICHHLANEDILKWVHK